MANHGKNFLQLMKFVQLFQEKGIQIVLLFADKGIYKFNIFYI